MTLPGSQGLPAPKPPPPLTLPAPATVPSTKARKEGGSAGQGAGWGHPVGTEGGQLANHSALWHKWAPNRGAQLEFPEAPHGGANLCAQGQVRLPRKAKVRAEIFTQTDTPLSTDTQYIPHINTAIHTTHNTHTTKRT